MADFLYNLFNVGVIAGTVLALGSTIGTIWTGGVKARYGDERVAANEAETARANEGAAEANRQAAQLRLDLERERLERVKLQASLSSRHLTPEQVASIKTVLLSLSSPPPITVELIGDQEANQYGNEILGCLSVLRTRITINEVGEIFPIQTGLLVRGPESHRIAEAFRQADVPVVELPDLGNSDLEVTIGHKPPAP